MEWLAIFALIIWAARQHHAIMVLERRLKATEDRAFVAPRARETPTSVAEPPSPEPIVDALRGSSETFGTPFLEAPPARLEIESEPEPRPEPEAEPVFVPPRAEPAPPRTASVFTRESVSTWLAENGLAWIGGGGLALGGLLLVGYAAQRGLFIPEFRIALAVILGALMVGASEWILRQKPTIAGGRHLLAAAVSAGAGAVTLYGAVCAAHGLYHLMPLGVAAVLAAAVSLGLLGLSLRHGEPLALIALVGAFLTPAFTGLSDWSPAVLAAYAVLIGATGFAIAAERLWAKAGGAAVIGLLLLSGVPLVHKQAGSAAILQALAAAGPFAAVMWRRRFRLDDATKRAAVDFKGLPAVGLLLASVASLGLWSLLPFELDRLPYAVVLSSLLILLGAAMAAFEIVSPKLLAAPVGAAVYCQLAAMGLLGHDARFVARLPWTYALTGLIPAVALVAALRAPAAARTLLLTIGAVAVAILASLTWPLLREAGITTGWAPAAILSAAMFGLAVVVARRVEQASSDRGLALWLAGAAELAFLAIHAATPPRFEPAAFGLSAVVLAFAATRLSWRGLAQASVAGGLVTLASMLQPAFLGEALDGRLPLPLLIAAGIAAAVLVLVASLLIGRSGEGVRNEAEAQGASALMNALLAAFTALHVVLSHGSGIGEDGLFEASLRTLLLLTTGLLLVLRQRDDDGPITRWRTVIVVSVGVAHGLLLQGLVWNPWWGAGQPFAGPPVLNTLVLAYLAPVGLLAAISWRRRPADDRWTQGWLLAAPVFGFLWALLAVRHLFHGPAMSFASLERSELGAYAVVLMLTARAVVEPRLGLASPQAKLLRAAAPAVGWVALGWLVLVFGLVASPWWGFDRNPLTSVWSGALLFSLQTLGAVLAWGVSRRGATVGRAALVTAAGLCVLLLAHLIRWAFHGLDLAGGISGRSEGAAYMILALLTARALRSPRLETRTSAGWLVRIAPVFGWLIVSGAVLVFAVRASPWWGPFDQPLAPIGSAILLFGLYAAAAVLLASLRTRDDRFGQAALAAGVGTLFVLLTLLIRYAFHGADMSVPLRDGSLETWTFSALWAVFGLVVLSTGSARKDVVLRWAGLTALALTALKLVVFDLARLEGVVRAASFLAVGALFIGGALVARRLNARHKLSEAAEAEPPAPV